MELGGSWGGGVKSTPQRGPAELSGGSATSCGGSNPPDPPSNTALAATEMTYRVLLKKHSLSSIRFVHCSYSLLRSTPTFYVIQLRILSREIWGEASDWEGPWATFRCLLSPKSDLDRLIRPPSTGNISLPAIICILTSSVKGAGC